MAIDDQGRRGAGDGRMRKPFHHDTHIIVPGAIGIGADARRRKIHDDMEIVGADEFARAIAWWVDNLKSGDCVENDDSKQQEALKKKIMADGCFVHATQSRRRSSAAAHGPK